MSSDWPPALPERYRLHDPEYEQPWYVTGFLFIWIVGVFVGVPALVIGVHDLDMAVAIVWEVLQPDSAGESVVYLGWTAATLSVIIGDHEAVHGFVGRWGELLSQMERENCQRIHFERGVLEVTQQRFSPSEQ